jgi:cytoskeleton protein RodZ
MTIGERLEEARRRKGVSIREAADATKIRGDYLLAMEETRLEDIDLPRIYVRGFLKNYARFLRLDPEKILTDYEAHVSHREGSLHPDRPTMGTVAIEREDEEEHRPPSAATASGGPAGASRPAPIGSVAIEPDQEPGERPRPETLEAADNTLYIKIGVISGSVAVVALLLVFLVNLLRSPAAPEMDPQLLQPEATQTTPSNQLVLRASGDVTVIVDQTSDRSRLFQGTLNAGDAVSVDREGPVSIRFTDGEALVIERDGQTVRPGTSGPGRTVIQ